MKIGPTFVVKKENADHPYTSRWLCHADALVDGEDWVVFTLVVYALESSTFDGTVHTIWF